METIFHSFFEAYLLPALACIDANRAAVQVLIVVPTRELGLQVGRVAKRLAAASDAAGDSTSVKQQNRKIMVMNVLQGSHNRRQRAWAWAEPPHVVIGTPQELCDMVQLGGIRRYNSVRYVVVDEVDACLLNNAGSMTPKLASSALHGLLSKYLSPSFDDGTTALNKDSAVRDVAMTGFQQLRVRPFSSQRQTVFASATIPQPRHFLRQCIQNQWTLRDPVHICLGSGELMLPDTLDHAYAVCVSTGKKLAVLRRLLNRIQQSALASEPDGPQQQESASPAFSTSAKKKVLVFCDVHRPVEEIAIALSRDLNHTLVWKESYGIEQELGVSTVISILRYEDSLSQRAAAMDSFRNEIDGSIMDESGVSLRVLIAAGDLSARGLDIEDVTHVINFDLPPNADTYVHRAGRTGRFQRFGSVLSMITPEQEFVLQRQVNKLNIRCTCIARQQQSHRGRR